MSEWRDVPNWEGLYVVSDHGEVARIVNGERRLLAPYVAANGYPMARLSRHSAVSPEYVHRLVLKAFRGKPPAGDQGCHRNGIRTDNALTNLYWGSSSQNTFDSVRHGTHPQASKTHCKRGHEFTEDNIIRTSEGYRRCRPCAQTYQHNYKREKAKSA